MTRVPATLLPVFEPNGLTEEVVWVRSNGVELLLPASDRVVTPYLLSKRSWDTTLGKLILDAMAHGTSFLDVGAMIGYFTALVAKTYPECRAYAVEPNPESLEIAAINLERYDNAILLEGGVASASVGRVGLDVDHVNVGNSHLVPVDADIPAVATVPLLDLVEEYHADVVKVDVQGMEADVLASLDVKDLLQPDLTIFCEVTPNAWGGSDRIRRTVQMFVDAGFSVYFIHENETLSSYAEDRLQRALASTSSWWDHFELMLVRGRYNSVVSSR